MKEGRTEKETETEREREGETERKTAPHYWIALPHPTFPSPSLHTVWQESVSLSSPKCGAVTGLVRKELVSAG